MLHSGNPYSEDRSEYSLRVLMENSSWWGWEWSIVYDWDVG
jgi:hypothetical protein